MLIWHLVDGIRREGNRLLIAADGEERVQCARGQARKLLRANWGRVFGVAVCLLNRGELNGDDVAYLYRESEGLFRKAG